MRIDGQFLNWGVFFILLGAIPLAVQANVLDRDTVSRAWQLWPVLFIAAGVAVLARGTRLHFTGGLIAAATFGLMVGGVLAAGDLGNIGGACGGDPGRAYPTQQGTLGNGSVSVQFNCGGLGIATGSGSAWSLAGTSDNGSPPSIDTSAGRLDIRSHSGFNFLGFGTHQSWTLTLPVDPTLDLDLQVNAGVSHVALGGAHIGTLRLQGNAGDSVLDLSEAASIGNLQVHVNAGTARISLPNGSMTGTLDANAGSVSLCLPTAVGLRITTSDNIASGNNFVQAGLTKNGNTWESANAATAATLINLTASANAGSINLNPQEGCR